MILTGRSNKRLHLTLCSCLSRGLFFFPEQVSWQMETSKYLRKVKLPVSADKRPLVLIQPVWMLWHFVQLLNRAYFENLATCG